MRYRCSRCKTRGVVNIPSNFPAGKKVSVRCKKCGETHLINIGRLWPQEDSKSYDLFIPENNSLDDESDRRKIINNIWVKVTGRDGNNYPLFAFQGSYSYPHEIIQDLLEPLKKITRICYFELPGSRRNPLRVENVKSFDRKGLLYDAVFSLKNRLKAPRCYMLSHLSSAINLLDWVLSNPEDVCSLVLIEPDLYPEKVFTKITRSPEFKHTVEREKLTIHERRKFLYRLFRKAYKVPVENSHLLGLSSVISSGFSLQIMKGEIKSKVRRRSFTELSGIKTPASIYISKDGRKSVREDAFFLQSALPCSRVVELEKGGDWTAWLSREKILPDISSHILEKSCLKPDVPVGNSEIVGKSEKVGKIRTISGQPIVWQVISFIILCFSLTYGLSKLPLRPDYLKVSLPIILGSILSFLWFTAPQKMNIPVFLRLNTLHITAFFASLLSGVLLGFSWMSLKSSLPSTGWLSQWIPKIFVSAEMEFVGTMLYFISFLFAGLICFGVIENILLLRRSKLTLLIPVLLFSFVPLSVPDIIFKLPLALAAAYYYQKSGSLYSPFSLIGGFFAGINIFHLSSLQLAFLTDQLTGIPGYVAAALLFILTMVGLSVFQIKGSTVDAKKKYLYKLNQNLKLKQYIWLRKRGRITLAVSTAAAGVLIGFFSRSAIF